MDMVVKGKKRLHVVIVGSGWAGYTLCADLDLTRHQVTVVSPEPTSTYTPLLASAVCGLFDFRITEEPIRRKSRPVTLYQATVENVDWSSKTLHCTSQIASFDNVTFEINYDVVVFAQGCKGNTFGIPGVEEHSLKVRTTKDAVALRQKISDAIELANLPTTSPERCRDLLHIAIVGGGATGVEIAAEVSDTVNKDLKPLYPNLKDYFSISIYDVAPNILAMFEKDLSTYAMESFRHRGVEIATGTQIRYVSEGRLATEQGTKIGFGVLIWATGNAPVPLTSKLDCKKSTRGLVRIVTDAHLRVLDSEGLPIPGVYAIGDAADIEANSLPTTAEVAVQKAKYLAKALSASTESKSAKPFRFSEKRMVAYLGASQGIWKRDKVERRGRLAWLAWRSTSLSWTRHPRKKILILVNWMLNYFYGKDIARN